MAGHNHEGHRQRIKKRVKNYGLKTLEEHEILEVLLTYSIPRKDTNNIAHELLNTFGSLNNVLDADPSALKNVIGVGAETALFLKMLGDLVEIYLAKAPKGPSPNLSTKEKCVNYFRSHFRIKKNESFYCFCLSASGRLVHYFAKDGTTDEHINFPFKEIIDNITIAGVRSVIILHTHPNGLVNPSLEDIVATKRIQSVCSVLGVRLLDHIILNETEDYSFNKSNQLEPMNLNQANKIVQEMGFILNRK